MRALLFITLIIFTFSNCNQTSTIDNQKNEVLKETKKPVSNKAPKPEKKKRTAVKTKSAAKAKEAGKTSKSRKTKKAN